MWVCSGSVANSIKLAPRYWPYADRNGCHLSRDRTLLCEYDGTPLLVLGFMEKVLSAAGASNFIDNRGLLVLNTYTRVQGGKVAMTRSYTMCRSQTTVE